MTFSRTAFTSLVCLVASGGLAAAQDGDDAAQQEPPPDPTASPAPEPVAAATGRWPRAVFARPLTLPEGLAQVGGDIVATNAFDGFGLNLVGGYGISDDLEVTGFYLFSLDDFNGKGNLDVDVGYKLARGAAGGKLEVIGRGRVGYDIGGESANPLRLGAHVQYSLTDKIALITPGQQLSIALEATPEVMGVGGAREIFLQLPVAVGYQATPELYLQLDTTLAKIKIADSANELFGADSTPIALTGVYNAMPALDVIGSFAFNLNAPADDGNPMTDEPGVGDSVTVTVGARYYLGDL